MDDSDGSSSNRSTDSDGEIDSEDFENPPESSSDEHNERVENEAEDSVSELSRLWTELGTKNFTEASSLRQHCENILDCQKGLGQLEGEEEDNDSSDLPSIIPEQQSNDDQVDQVYELNEKEDYKIERFLVKLYLGIKRFRSVIRARRFGLQKLIVYRHSDICFNALATRGIHSWDWSYRHFIESY